MLKIIFKKYYFNIFLDKKYFEPHLLQHIFKHPFVSPKTNLKGEKDFLPSQEIMYLLLIFMSRQTVKEANN